MRTEDVEVDGEELAAAAWEAVARSMIQLLRRFEAAGDFKPLRSKEYDLLYLLSTAGERGLRPRQLYDLTLLAQPSISRMIDRMENAGLVERTASKEDGRGVQVRLSEKGRELQEEIAKRRSRSLRATIGLVLDDEEIKTIMTIANKMLKHMPEKVPAS